jgi:hypothetical protein
MGGFDQFLWDDDLWDHLPPEVITPGQASVFLGLIDAAPVRLGLANALLPLGLVNAAGQRLGTIQAAPYRLGKIPVRTGM